MSRKGLKNIFNAIGRKIFNKSTKTEVEYGQTLTKKRRRNCVLKSVSSLSSCNEEKVGLVHPTYRIEFEFSKEDSQFRGSVMNFQKIDPSDVCRLKKCCDKCYCPSEDREDSCSGGYVSSDSACEVASSSSCDDSDCEFRETRKRKKKLGRRKKKSVPGEIGTVENFIRIHGENFENGSETGEEPKYETLEPKYDRPPGKKPEPNYDVLTSRSDYDLSEPRYENLKSMENFYERPAKTYGECSENCPFKKIKDLVRSDKTYDEVIESLKLFHSGVENCSENGFCSERADNEINYYFENYVNLQNRLNNGIEQDLLSY